MLLVPVFVVKEGDVVRGIHSFVMRHKCILRYTLAAACYLGGKLLRNYFFLYLKRVLRVHTKYI